MSRLTTAETARRLGVKPATVYAYVSRGLLHPSRSPDDRTSSFDHGEVERLAARGRAGAGTGPGGRPLTMTSDLTLIEDGRYYYRGLDALDLAGERSFEEVAAWLWSGSFDATGPWVAPPSLAGWAAQLPPEVTSSAGVLPVDRLRLVVAAAGVLDPLRYELAAESVTRRARGLVAAAVESVPLRGAEPRPSRGGGPPSIAARLWPRLTAEPPDARRLRALDAALVLLADHELPVSTVAVRLAASTGAHLYAVVGAGLGVVDGPRHGGASLGAEALLAEVAAGADPGVVIGARLRRGERIPGFGQPLYPQGDPRAVLLLERAEHAVGRCRLRDARAVMATMAEAGLPAANVDFALAALAFATGMIRGAGELLFAVARTVGWVAHALEEYAGGTVYRPRALYTGPRPGG
jgi:citrate synthase